MFHRSRRTSHGKGSGDTYEVVEDDTVDNKLSTTYVSLALAVYGTRPRALSAPKEKHALFGLYDSSNISPKE